MQTNQSNNWDADHRDIFNNNGKSGPVIIHAECRVKRGVSDKLKPYDCISGSMCNSEFRVTIHNYESEALGFDPTIKSEQNYYRFLHLSTLLNFPWGMSIRFRDNDGVVFGVGDIIRLLEERSSEVMKKWEEEKVEFKERQDGTLDKLGSVNSNNTPKTNNDDTMEI